MSIITFLIGLALGAMYAPVIKPLVLKAWAKIQPSLNAPKE